MNELEAAELVIDKQDKTIAELRQERDKLYDAITALTAERDQYLKLLGDCKVVIPQLVQERDGLRAQLAAITEALGCKAGYELQAIADRDGVITDTDSLRQLAFDSRAELAALKEKYDAALKMLAETTNELTEARSSSLRLENAQLRATLELAQSANRDYLVQEHDLRNALAGVQRERAVLQTALDESRRSGRAILAAHNELARLVGLYRLSARKVAEWARKQRELNDYFYNYSVMISGYRLAENKRAYIFEKAAAAWKLKAKDYRAQLMGYIHVQFTSSDKSAMFLRLQHNQKILWGRKTSK